MVTFVACGTDDSGVGPETCAGAACEDGGSESSTTDGPSGTDGTTPTDGGLDGADPADADASIVSSCDGGAPGTLDESFGDGGLVWLKYSSNAQAFAVAVQGDGKVVIAGGTAPRKFAVVRLLPDGTPDPSFGTAGLAENTILSIDTQPLRAVAIQPDGKIVAAGPAIGPGPTSYDFVLLRYNTNGSLDTTFGAAGVAVTDFGNTDDYPRSVAMQPDGKILVAGQSQSNAMLSTQNIVVARYNTDGSLDMTFGSEGKVVVDVQGTPDVGGHLFVLSSGKVVVVGQAGTVAGGSPYQSFAVRLNSDGALDTTFASTGRMVTTFTGGGDQRANGVVADGQGGLLLGGVYSTGATPDDFGLLRLLGTGAPDLTFGDGGLVAVDFNGRSDAIGSVLVEDDGKILAVGLSVAGSTTSTKSIAYARFLSSGQLDPSFGLGGRVLLSPPTDTALGAERGAITGCDVVVVGTWSYDLSTIPKNAMGVARLHR